MADLFSLSKCKFKRERSGLRYRIHLHLDNEKKPHDDKTLPT